jgi:hypothetical protein
MFAKGQTLLRAVTVIIVKIEPSFANGDDTRVRRTLDKLRSIHTYMLVRFMWVNADGRPHVGFLFRKTDNLIPLALTRRNVEHGRHAAVSRAGKNLALLLD